MDVVIVLSIYNSEMAIIARTPVVESIQVAVFDSVTAHAAHVVNDSLCEAVPEVTPKVTAW